MITTYELSADYRARNEEAHGVLGELLGKLSVVPQELRLSRDKELYQETEGESDFYLVKEGYLKCLISGRQLFFLEKGDLVGVGSFFVREGVSVASEFAVVLDRYPREAFLEQIFSNVELARLWNHYLEIMTVVYQELLLSLTPDECRVEPETMFFEPGETIILENTEPDKVYTLLQGKVDVCCGGKKVGEVLPDEVFGAMAAATNTPRTASVIARSSTLVLAVPKENFLALVESHPGTVMNLIESMSRIIVTQNEQLLEAQKEKNL